MGLGAGVLDVPVPMLDDPPPSPPPPHPASATASASTLRPSRALIAGRSVLPICIPKPLRCTISILEQGTRTAIRQMGEPDGGVDCPCEAN